MFNRRKEERKDGKKEEEKKPKTIVQSQLYVIYMNVYNRTGWRHPF